MTSSLDAVRRALARPPVTYDAPKHAAVAAVFLPGEELLFIRRAERPGDPWSGHVAFPGGRVESSDAGFREAAIRETHEEVGLDLSGAEVLGALDSLAPMAGLTTLAVHPFVFSLDREPDFRPNHEVASVHRVRLADLLAGAGRGRMDYAWGGRNLQLPCVDFDGVRLWGMTLRVVDDLLDRIDGRGIGFAR